MHARANARISGELNEYVRRYEWKSKDFVFFLLLFFSFLFFFIKRKRTMNTVQRTIGRCARNCRRCTRCRWTFEHSKTRIWNCDDRSFGGARIPFLSFTSHTLSLSLFLARSLSLSPARSFARSLARSLALFLSLSFFLSPSSNDRFRGFRRLSKENPRRKNAEYRDGDEKRSQPPWSEALRYSTREPF